MKYWGHLTERDWTSLLKMYLEEMIALKNSREKWALKKMEMWPVLWREAKKVTQASGTETKQNSGMYQQVTLVVCALCSMSGHWSEPDLSCFKGHINKVDRWMQTSMFGAKALGGDQRRVFEICSWLGQDM